MHPNFALYERKPHAFLPAGRSQATQISAHLIVLTTPHSRSIPFQKSCSSFTIGSRYVLMSRCGSSGPGMIPARITFSRLYRTERGRLRTVKYIAPTEYFTC